MSTVTIKFVGSNGQLLGVRSMTEREGTPFSFDVPNSVGYYTLNGSSHITGTFGANDQTIVINYTYNPPAPTYVQVTHTTQQWVPNPNYDPVAAARLASAITAAMTLGIPLDQFLAQQAAWDSNPANRIPYIPFLTRSGQLHYNPEYGPAPNSYYYSAWSYLGEPMIWQNITYVSTETAINQMAPYLSPAQVAGLLQNWSIPQDVLNARAYDAGYRNAIAPHGSLPIDYRENGDWTIFAPADPLTAEQLNNLARQQQFGGDPNYNRQYYEQKAQELDDWRHDPNRNRDMLIGSLMIGSLFLLLGGAVLVAAGSLGFLSGAAAAVSTAAGAVVSTVSGLVSTAGSFINNIGSMIIPPMVNANGTMSTATVISSEAVAKGIITLITGGVAANAAYNFNKKSGEKNKTRAKQARRQLKMWKEKSKEKQNPSE